MDEQNSERLRRVIAQAVAATIEDMAFSIVEPVEDAVPTGGDVISTSLRLIEPRSAELWLLLPRDTGRALARSLYSIEDAAITDALLRDVAGELLNTIAGNVMRAVLPPDTRFELGLPEAGPGAFSADDCRRCTCSFTIDGMSMTVVADRRIAGP